MSKNALFLLLPLLAGVVYPLLLIDQRSSSTIAIAPNDAEDYQHR